VVPKVRTSLEVVPIGLGVIPSGPNLEQRPSCSVSASNRLATGQLSLSQVGFGDNWSLKPHLSVLSVG